MLSFEQVIYLFQPQEGLYVVNSLLDDLPLIITDLRLLPKKAEVIIFFTLFGIVTVSKKLPLNAFSPIVSNPSGNITLFILLS